MPHIDNETSPPTAHVPSNTLALLDRLKESGQSIVLTIKGGAEFVVRDEGSYEELCNLVDRLETIEGIRRGLESMKRGEGRPVEEVFEELRQKYELSD